MVAPLSTNLYCSGFQRLISKPVHTCVSEMMLVYLPKRLFLFLTQLRPNTENNVGSENKSVTQHVYIHRTSGSQTCCQEGFNKNSTMWELQANNLLKSNIIVLKPYKVSKLAITPNFTYLSIAFTKTCTFLINALLSGF